MSYTMNYSLRIISLSGLLLFAFSYTFGWSYGILAGVLLWLLGMPACVYGCVGLLVESAKSLWMIVNSKKEPVPEIAKVLAEKFDILPPKKMRVSLGRNINAAVGGSTLYITEGLKSRLDTISAEGVVAHEMAHMAQDQDWKLLAGVFSTMIIFVFIMMLLDEPGWLVSLGAMLTILPVIIPPISRSREYRADLQASEIVGIDKMVSGLNWGVERSDWNRDSETHPSLKRRLARLANE